eukprot:2293598-Rhodomonas_salina.2
MAVTRGCYAIAVVAYGPSVWSYARYCRPDILCARDHSLPHTVPPGQAATCLLYAGTLLVYRAVAYGYTAVVPRCCLLGLLGRISREMAAISGGCAAITLIVLVRTRLNREP